jgi:hypothetical protein
VVVDLGICSRRIREMSMGEERCCGSVPFPRVSEESQGNEGDGNIKDGLTRESKHARWC